VPKGKLGPSLDGSFRSLNKQPRGWIIGAQLSQQDQCAPKVFVAALFEEDSRG